MAHDYDHAHGQAGGVGADPHKAAKQAFSVYSLAMTPHANMLAAGTSDALIRLLDPRSGRKVGRKVCRRNHLQHAAACTWLLFVPLWVPCQTCPCVFPHCQHAAWGMHS